MSKEGTREISLTEVQQHNKVGDLWVVVRSKVYDVSVYMDEHPGGDIMLDALPSHEATDLFDDVGHSEEALEIMEQLCLGTLVPLPRL